MYAVRLFKSDARILTQFNDNSGNFHTSVVRDVLGSKTVLDGGWVYDFMFERLKDARYARVILFQHLAAKGCNDKCPNLYIGKVGGNSWNYLE